MVENLHGGQYIHFAYTGAPGETAILIDLYDADGKSVTVQPWQRLLIDTVNIELVVASASDSATLFAGPAGGTPATSNDILISVSANTDDVAPQNVHGSREGISLPIGVSLALVGSGASSPTVYTTGTGRLTCGATQGARPAWKESSSPAQHVPTTIVTGP